MVSSNLQEKFNRDKARKNKNKNLNNGFCHEGNSSFFSHKIHIIRFEKQISILSQLTVIELGPPVSEFSTRISTFYGPTDSKHKLYKTRVKNWLSIGSELGSPRLGTCSHNHQHHVQLRRWWGVLKFYIPIFKVLEQSWRPFTSLKLCKCSQN